MSEVFRFEREFTVYLKINEFRASFCVFEQDIAFRNVGRIVHLLLLKFRHIKSIKKKNKFSSEYTSETSDI